MLLDREREAEPARNDDSLGEWLREGLIRCCGTDDDPWAVGRVGEAAARLNEVRQPQPPLEVVILFEAEPAAFIGPGRYVYLTRGLLHRAWWPEAIVMVVAHEMAHHDLGHTRFWTQQLAWLRGVPGSPAVHLFRHAAQRWLYGPEWEGAADLLALELCLRAGYDGRRGIDVYDLLERYALDAGDIETALGPDEEVVSEAPGGWLRSARGWLRERTTGYRSIRERKELLLERLRVSTGRN